MLLIRQRASSRARKPAARGATLIEVLVSIVIASIGLLALAGLSASSLRYSKMAQYRAAATQLATDISERMRANYEVPATLDSYQFQTSFESQATPPTIPLKTCRVVADSCTPGEIAAMDLYEWRMAARSLLPGGAVFLKKDPVVTGAFDLWLAWKDPAMAADEIKKLSEKECPNNLEVSTTADVRCTYFRVNL